MAKNRYNNSFGSDNDIHSKDSDNNNSQITNEDKDFDDSEDFENDKDSYQSAEISLEGINIIK